MIGDAPELIVAGIAEQPDDELGRMIEEVHGLLLKHPFAARGAFRALVAEGRRFAETEEGARWKRRLEGSELIQRGRSVWEIATGGMLDEAPTLLPTQLIDLLAHAVTLDDLEPALARAVEPRQPLAESLHHAAELTGE